MTDEKHMNAVTKVESTAVAATTPMDMLRIVIEQGADIAKIEKLMELQERFERNEARKAFDAAISAAKAKIKPIAKKRTVDFTSSRGRTNYVYEDLALVAAEVDPILAEHGLSYRYRAMQDGKKLTVTCIVSHRNGHSEETTLSAENDESGNKNTIQGVGSSATYLQRYTLKLALGLSAAKDDDAQASESDERPAGPDGYEDWRADMTALADEGLPKLQEAWGKSLGDFRRYVVKHDEQWWVELKKRAEKAATP